MHEIVKEYSLAAWRAPFFFVCRHHRRPIVHRPVRPSCACVIATLFIRTESPDRCDLRERIFWKENSWQERKDNAR
jgi:hypothetical protein